MSVEKLQKDYDDLKAAMARQQKLRDQDCRALHDYESSMYAIIEEAERNGPESCQKIIEIAQGALRRLT
jgi:hypothetical protein